MNPADKYPCCRSSRSTSTEEAKSEWELQLENAEQYFGDDFPGNEGLTCQKCGAAVNLGWQHIAWHEERK